MKLNKFCKKILSYISNDIQNGKNPIKYHNMIFNNNWNKENHKIRKFYDSMKRMLEKIIISFNIKKLHQSMVKDYTWKPTQHDKPYIYYKHLDIPYDQFANLYNLGKIHDKISFTDEYPKVIKQFMNYLQNGWFVDLNIKLYVENNINKCEHYSFQHMELYYFFNNNNNIDINIKYDLLQHIYKISKWLYSILPSKKITLCYFDTPIKKTYNNSVNFLSSENVNSGSSSDKLIMIWRREEICKVLIHELIHYLDMDIKNDTRLFNIIKYNIGNIEYPIIINETITELQAQFLNTIYQSIILNDKAFDNFKTMYNYEQIFSWYQFAKIMKYYSINNYKIDNLVKHFNQSTNVFSYYILKSLLTLRFSDILFLFDHYKNHINEKSNNCNIDKCNIIIKYITTIHKKSYCEYNILINKIIHHLKLDDKSLRMTIFGPY